MLFLSRAAGSGVRHIGMGVRLRYFFKGWIDPTQEHIRERLALNELQKK